MDYFDYLDKAGGFFYERWGDAPVHSIAAALFLPFEKIHYFYDIGYRHEPFQVRFLLARPFFWSNRHLAARWTFGADLSCLAPIHHNSTAPEETYTKTDATATMPRLSMNTGIHARLSS
jgi:hypothetical protein